VEDWPDLFRRRLDDAALMLGFFSRLPVSASQGEGKFAAALWAAPLAGVVIGVLGALAYALAFALNLPPLPSALIALAATLLATGCLHEDGLSDVADGFGGGRTAEQKLTIMRDSRIGAYGASALLLSLLLRASALAAIVSPAGALAALVAAHGASRALLPLFLRIMPPARGDGLGAGVGVIPARAANAALALGLLCLLLLGPLPALFAAVLLAAAFLIFRRLALRHIGGQTGDVCGALQQAAEILVLLVAAASLS
jgi:adenosylcobinamide-GDP ribazoletransferase